MSILKDNREFNKVLSAIKRVFSRSQHRRGVLDKHLSKRKGPRGGKMYRCQRCGKSFSAKDVQVDHIDPVIPIGTPAYSMSWDTLVGRIYCDTNNLQVLCTGCHKIKSATESSTRAKIRRERKKK